MAAIILTSRTQAIADGVFVDVTNTPEYKECNIRYPVALTRAVYESCVRWTEADTKSPQDEAARLWDLLYMFALQEKRNGQTSFSFELYVVPRKGRGVRSRRVQLQAIRGPGDTSDPVYTISHPTKAEETQCLPRK